MLKRRFSLILASAAGVVLLALATVYSRTVEALWPVSWIPNPQLASPVVDPFLIELQERTFRYFWDTANSRNGLVPDRYPSPSASSVAAVGFALTTYPIAVERHYVTRKEARQRTLTTLRFLRNAPQGPQARGVAGYKGFFYHFLDMKTGERAGDSELSTVDTAILLAGALFVQSYFDRPVAEEIEIRKLVDEIYRRVDWRWAQPNAPAISHGWSPEEGFIEYDWRGYNEAMLVYLLALGSPTHPVGSEAWTEWTSTYDASWRTYYGQQFLNFSPLFGHQYTHVWMDFRAIQDAYMRRRGLDYFENSRRATYAQRAYAMTNPAQCKFYGANVWGITASDGPGDLELENASGKRRYRGYYARGAGVADTHDDCTLAPTAAAASIVFAPELAIPAVLAMHARFGEFIYSDFGFLDAFNPSFDFHIPVRSGRSIPGFGWVAGDYIGIDQGAIFAMIENYRSGMVWDAMRKNAHLRRGLERAGFTGGWLSASR
ncbi:MAG: glucoamylase family protein [Casimicrobiaceae bacterium]